MKQKSIKQAILSLCLLFSGLLIAQKSVNGTITDQDGVPLPGATIVVLETNDGATTDFDGNYSISVEEGESLVFSFVGYATQTAVVGMQNTLNISLAEGNQLTEVVVTALGLEREAISSLLNRRQS